MVISLLKVSPQTVSTRGPSTSISDISIRLISDCGFIVIRCMLVVIVVVSIGGSRSRQTASTQLGIDRAESAVGINLLRILFI